MYPDFFEHHQEADDVFAKIIEQGITPEPVQIQTSASTAITH
jgi:hypothetical protein